MNKKKIIYGIAIIVVVILGYLNYFGDEGEVGKTEQVVETTNVTYRNEDYLVEAQKQKDYIKENETGFEKAKAKVNDMFLSGDNIFIDKVRNLALKNNILGGTKKWIIVKKKQQRIKIKKHLFALLVLYT